METRSNMLDRLIPALGEHTAKVLADASAAKRHEWRVEQTINAAMANSREGKLGQLLHAYASVSLDLGGVGGRMGAEGHGTDRMPWARGLGSGRRNAGDGAAWMAASEQALLTIQHRIDQEVCFKPGDYRPFIQMFYVEETQRVMIQLRRQKEVLAEMYVWELVGDVLLWVKAECIRAIIYTFGRKEGLYDFPSPRWTWGDMRDINTAEKLLQECELTAQDTRRVEWLRNAESSFPELFLAYRDADDETAEKLAEKALTAAMGNAGFTSYIPNYADWPG